VKKTTPDRYMILIGDQLKKEEQEIFERMITGKSKNETSPEVG